MKIVLFLGFLLAFVFVVESFVEDESFRSFADEEEYEARHHLRKVNFSS